MFFCGCRTVVRCLWNRQFEYNETAEKPPTGRFFWVVRIGSLLGGFSLTKAMHKLGKLHKVQLRVAQNKSKILQKV